MDGCRDALYGNAVVVQKVNSAFANADGGAPHQVAAAYAFVDSDARALYLFLAGNVNHGRAKLHLFIDGLDGENTLRSPHVYDGARSRHLVNLTFDADFGARFHVFARLTSNNTLAATLIDRIAVVDGVTMVDNGVSTSYRHSSGKRQVSVAPIANSDGLAWFFGNNSNGGGVEFDPSGGSAPSPGAAESVTTGWEFSFNLSYFDGKLRDPNRLSICAMVGTDDFLNMSNQVLGSMPLGYKSTLSAGLNLTAVEGLQYFDVALAPTMPSGSVAWSASDSAGAITMPSGSGINDSMPATSLTTSTMPFISNSSPQISSSRPQATAVIVGSLVASIVLFVLGVVVLLRWFAVRSNPRRLNASNCAQEAAHSEYASTYAALR